MAARILSIPPGVRFLPTFVQALLAGEIVPGVSRADGPFALADTTIYVPTRRAARALLAEFAAAAGPAATTLPKIRPLGAVDEEAALFADPADAGDAFDPDLPDAIGEIERRFILADLILRWSRSLRGAIVRLDASGALTVDESDAMVVGATPADALALAGHLAGLIDEFIVEGAPWSDVRHLAAEDYDGYWGITARFLQIAIEQWPAILNERERIDAADRRARLIEREIADLAAHGARGPMIVLGSTGTNRATARLMRAIARLDRGAVALPGLDQTMPEADWRSVVGGAGAQPAWGHPQAALARLLLTLDCDRRDVRALGAPTEALAQRAALVSQALAPSEATAAWRDWRAGRDAEIAAALDGVALIEAADQREEALAIAIRLREVLETPGATAALITPDRAIARRVRAELARWNLAVDDSGGESLAVSPAGGFARATLVAAHDGGDVALVALLAHRAAAPTADRTRTAWLAQKLEMVVLRATPYDPDPARRIESARSAARERHAHPAARRTTPAEWAEIERLLRETDNALAPLRALAGQHALPVWIAAHRACLALLGAQVDAPEGDDDRMLARLFDEIAGAGDAQAAARLHLTLREYVGLFDQLLSAAVVRGPQNSHARLKILGLLEARLLDADLVVLAGLDEAVWPPQPKSDPFLNRPLRAQIGLTPPERRIGQSAHDFAMAMGAPHVVLTRALKRDGTPTVASRFLQRLAALADACFDPVRERGATWRALAREIDRPQDIRAIAQPEPKPPLALRPTALSVTRIEVLRRDPYAIYADRILELKPAGALDAEPDAAEQGTAVHAVLRELALRWPSGPLPADARDLLIEAARIELAAFFANPTWRAFGWPKVVAGLAFVLGYEAGRRPALTQIVGEANGTTLLTLADGAAFKLTAQADRIEIDTDGLARIIDYKTGVAPTARQAKAGFASQLTLEAAMIERGGFVAIGKRDVDSAFYLKLGGPNGGKRAEIFDPKETTFADLVAAHWTQLHEMLVSYRDVETGYRSRPYVQYASRYSDYDHLARVKEWSASGGPEGGE